MDEEIQLSAGAIKLLKSLTQEHKPFDLMTLLDIFKVFKKRGKYGECFSEFKPILDELINNGIILSEKRPDSSIPFYFYSKDNFEFMQLPSLVKTSTIIQSLREQLLDKTLTIKQLSAALDFPIRRIKYTIEALQLLKVVAAEYKGVRSEPLYHWDKVNENLLPLVITEIVNNNQAY